MPCTSMRANTPRIAVAAPDTQPRLALCLPACHALPVLDTQTLKP